MSTKTCTSKESAGTTPCTVDDLPCDATRIGVDDEGFTVYYSRVHTAIYVARDGDVVFTRDDIEPGRGLVQFVDHISRTREWSSLNLYESWPDAFAAQLEEDR